MYTHAKSDPIPWYRQFWPWALIAIPAATVVACAVTIVIAIVSDDGLVTDSEPVSRYYTGE